MPLERPLRECWLLRVEHAQHHLPARVEQRLPDSLPIRRAGVRLKQDRHREQRRRDVEPMLPQEREDVR
jgi:hypothetical protein